jgi:hypothetical protein
MLQDGERVAGEWLLLAHGTRYNIASAEHLFVAFDILAHDRRRAYDDLIARCRLQDTITAAVVSDGPAVSVESALMKLGTQGFHDAVERPQGAVWRVEREGTFEFIAKYVSTDKVDGAFLPEISGDELVWNWPPEKL